jgi:hypothetical protein
LQDSIGSFLSGKPAREGLIKRLLNPYTRLVVRSADIRLAEGDRMVVLATSNGLRRIEHGIASITPKGWP